MFVGPRDWCEEEPAVECYCHNKESKQFSHQLKNLIDFKKDGEKSFYDLEFTIIHEKVDSYLVENDFPSFSEIVFHSKTQLLIPFCIHEVLQSKMNDITGKEFLNEFEDFVMFLCKVYSIDLQKKLTKTR